MSRRLWRSESEIAGGSERYAEVGWHRKALVQRAIGKQIRGALESLLTPRR